MKRMYLALFLGLVQLEITIMTIMLQIPTEKYSPGLDYYNYYAYFVSSGGGVDNYSNADWDSCGQIFTFLSK